jgi:hypothetical protein
VAAERYGVGLAASAADAETVVVADARSDRLMTPTGEALVGLMVAAAVAAPDCLSAAEAEPALTRDGCWESTNSATAKPATRVAPLGTAEAVAPAPGRSEPAPIAAARTAVPDLAVPDLTVPASLMAPPPLDRAPICPALVGRAPDLEVFAGTRSCTTELRAGAAEDGLAACAAAPWGMPMTAKPITAVAIVTAPPRRQANRCVALIMAEVPLILSKLPYAGA